MINKRSKVLKALSSAILGTLALGNCSTIWMTELTDEEYNKISKQKNENFLKKRAALMHSKKADEMDDNYASKAMEKQKKSFDEINADFQDTTAYVRLWNVIENLKVKYKNDRTAVDKVSKELNKLLGEQFNKTDDLSAISGVSVLLAEHIVYYSRINNVNVNVKDINLIDCIMINVCGKFDSGFSGVSITNIIEKLENIAKNVTENINKGV